MKNEPRPDGLDSDGRANERGSRQERPSRRTALKIGAGLTVGAAVWSEPTLKGLVRRPAYASATSTPPDCVELRNDSGSVFGSFINGSLFPNAVATATNRLGPACLVVEETGAGVVYIIQMIDGSWITSGSATVEFTNDQGHTVVEHLGLTGDILCTRLIPDIARTITSITWSHIWTSCPSKKP